MDFWFVFKKVASVGLTPITICLELVILGLLLLYFSRVRVWENSSPFWLGFKDISSNLGAVFIVFGSLLLYLCSIETVAHGLSGLLEKRHPPLSENNGRVALQEYPDYIVVLPGGDRYSNEKPAFSRLRRKTFIRLTRAIHIWKQYPEANLVFTGRETEVRPMKELAVEMGVDPERIIGETKSRDTKDHARYLKPMLEGRPFLLVTSAIHMPRAVALFEGQHLEPTPAPTDFHANPFQSFSLTKLVPRARNLLVSDEAFHEHLGIAWARIRDQMREEGKKPRPSMALPRLPSDITALEL